MLGILLHAAILFLLGFGELKVGDIEVDQFFFDTFFRLWVEVITLTVDNPDYVITHHVLQNFNIVHF